MTLKETKKLIEKETEYLKEKNMIMKCENKDFAEEAENKRY